jgi:hypothetical protein
VPILLQKSEIEVGRIIRENTRQEAIADSYSLARLTEVASEFNERRRGPPHLYTKTAPIAFRIFEPQCKTTFATVSAKSGLMQYSNLASGDPDALSGEVARWRHVGEMG